MTFSQMPPANKLALLFKVCTEIANEVADADGFVSVRKLLQRFQTKLRLRPLLVEGMIGSTSSVDGQRPEWTVLIDRERYPDVEGLIDSETAANPLPPRFRFTVAHELAHSLAFRTSEFGVVFEGVEGKDDRRVDLVRAIEAQTDRLAPLLLCAEEALSKRLRSQTGPLDINCLTRIRREFGITREVLLDRLALSRSTDCTGTWQRPQLGEFGLAIAEWNSPDNAILRRGPLLNFSRTVPKGLLTLRDRDRVPFDIAFGVQSLMDIIRNGEISVRTSAGTPASPDADQMNIEISIERDGRDPATEFLVLVRNARVKTMIEDFERIRMSRQRFDKR